MPVSVLYDHYNHGAPSNGVSEVQTLTLSGTITGGTFQLGFGSETTGAISWTDTDSTLVAAIDAALEALSAIGAGEVTAAAGTLSSGVGTVTLTFSGNLGKLALPLITVEDDSLEGSGAAVAVAQTTAGVTATARNAAAGEQLLDTANGNVYINTGSAGAPVWLVLG